MQSKTKFDKKENIYEVTKCLRFVKIVTSSGIQRWNGLSRVFREMTKKKFHFVFNANKKWVQSLAIVLLVALLVLWVLS